MPTPPVAFAIVANILKLVPLEDEKGVEEFFESELPELSKPVQEIIGDWLVSITEAPTENQVIELRNALHFEMYKESVKPRLVELLREEALAASQLSHQLCKKYGDVAGQFSFEEIGVALFELLRDNLVKVEKIEVRYHTQFEGPNGFLETFYKTV
jgi:hypothetical protein